MLNYPIFIISEPQVNLLFGKKKRSYRASFDHLTLTWSQTCAWSLKSTFLSYLLYYNSKVTIYWNQRRYCNIQNLPLMYDQPHPRYLEHSQRGKLKPLHQDFLMEIIHANMFLLAPSFYPCFCSHILTVMILLHIPLWCLFCYYF